MTKIRNVVFDMGGVLMKYEPVSFARPFVQDEDDARLVAAAVFDGHE